MYVRELEAGLGPVVPHERHDLVLVPGLDGEHPLGGGGDPGAGQHQVQGRQPVPAALVDVVLLVAENGSHQTHITGPLTRVVEGCHPVIVHHLEAPGHGLVERLDRLRLVLLVLNSDVHRELLLGVGDDGEDFCSVSELHVEQIPQRLLVRVALAGQEMDDGVALGVLAVEAPDGAPRVGAEVVHHLGQVTRHHAVVGDSRDLEGRDLVVVLLKHSLLDLRLGVRHQPLDHGVDLGEGVSGIGGIPLSTEDAEDRVLVGSNAGGQL